MALQDTSLIWKVLMVVQVIGLILSVTGFASPYHVQGKGRDKIHMGLWEACFDKCRPVTDYLDALRRDSTWVDVSKGMMGVSLGVEFAVILLSLLAIAITLTKLIGLITAALAFLSAVIGLIGVAVYQIEAKKLFEKWYYGITDISGWSLYVFLSGQLLYVLCGLGHILDSRQRNR